jgi:hypothetical protein
MSPDKEPYDRIFTGAERLRHVGVLAGTVVLNGVSWVVNRMRSTYEENLDSLHLPPVTHEDLTNRPDGN